MATLISCAVRQQQNGDRSAGDEQRIEPVEERRLAEVLVDARLHAQAFAHGVGRGERKDGRRKERCVEEPEGEKDEGVVAGQRPHGFGSVGGNLDGAHAVHEERGRAGHDDEPGDHVGEDAAHDDVEARGRIVLYANSLLHDRRLQVELHPRSDGRSHHADRHVDVALIPHRAFGQRDGGAQRLVPVGLGENAGKDIRDVDERGGKEDFLGAFVVAAQHQRPYKKSADGHGDEFGNVEQVQRAGNADELGDDVGVIDHHQQHHEHEGDAQAELLADEVAEALARDHPHAAAHLLHHDERDGDGNHGPQQGVTVLCAGLRVGEDAAGVVIDIGGNESGTEHGQKEKDPDSPALPHVESSS